MSTILSKQFILMRLSSANLTLILFLFLTGIRNHVNGQLNPFIENRKTKEHTQIPGTHLFFKFDDNDSIMNSLPAVMLNDFSGLQIFDLEGGDFKSNNRNMSIANFEAKGIHVLDSSSLKVNSYDALCFHVEQNGVRSIMLSFGDNTFSAMVNGMYFSPDEKVFSELIAVMSSIVYDKHAITFQEKDLPYTLLTEGTPYKFAKATSNLYLYSIDGVDKPKERDPFFIITSVPTINESDARSILENAVENMKKSGISNLVVITDKSYNSMGNKIYERIYEGEKTDHTIRYYCYLLVNNKQTIFFAGMAEQELDKTIEDFRNITRTIVIR